MPRIVECQPHIGGYIGRLIVIDRYNVQYLVPDVGRLVGRFFRLTVDQLDEIELQHGHEVPCGRCTVNGAVVPVLEEHRQDPAVIHMGMGYHNGVYLAERLHLRDVEVREPVAGRVYPGIYEYPALLRLKKRRRSADLPEASEGRHPDELLPGLQGGPGYLAAYAPEYLGPLLPVVPQISSDIRDRLGVYGRSPDRLYVPSGISSYLVEELTPLANYDMGVCGLDHDHARIIIEEHVRYVGIRRGHLLYPCLNVVGITEGLGIRSYVESLPELVGQLLCDIGILRELLEILGIYDDYRSFEFDARYIYLSWHYFAYLLT